MDQPQFDLATIDIIIIVLYFVGVIAHGVYMSRKGNEDAEGYFLAGRGLPWYLIGFSLFASNMSGSSFVGLMGGAYDNGIVIFNYEWTAALVLIFFSFFMLPYFLRANLFTIPEYLETRFDKRSRYAYSAFTVLAIMFIDTAGALYAGGLVITTVFSGFSLWQAVAVLAFVAGIYTILGGLSAVVVTDTVQAILLIVGATAIFIIGLNQVGGWSAMTSQLAPEQLSLIKPVDDDFLPWPGILGVLLLGFYYWTLNQFIVQRTLGARNLDEGRKGALFAGLLKLPNLFIMILPGVMALLLYPDLSNPDLVFPTLAFDLLPIGLRGLVMSALIAAIMSSLDSALNAASSLITLDFIKELRPETSQSTLVRLGRIITGIVMVIGAIYAPLIASFETLFEYFQSVLSYIIPAIVAVYIIGLFWKRINGNGAFWTILSGLIIGVPLFILKEVTNVWTNLGLPPIHFTYMAVLMFVFAFVLMTVISYATEAPDPEKIRKYTFTRENYREDIKDLDVPWYKDFRYQSAGLFALMTGVVVYFW